MESADAARRGTVLVVDDDPAVRDLIASALEDEGFAPVVVEDPRETVVVARELVPEAITLDLEMPALDGHGILRRLQDHARTREVPVVVVSADAEALTDRERTMVSRALAKPFELPELVSAIRAAVGRP
jgi:two-component system phosphate regulon response regulator PhoB